MVSMCKDTTNFRGGKGFLTKLSWLLLFKKEYRNIFYLRIGRVKWLLSYLPPLSSLYIWTKSENFGAGTYIQHGFSTVITAEKSVKTVGLINRSLSDIITVKNMDMEGLY